MKLLTKEILDRLPKLYAQENVKDPIVYLKLFTPDSSFSFYITEYDQKDTFFGWTWTGTEGELGYISLSEIMKARGGLGLPVERDKWFKPTPLSVVQAKKPNPVSGWLKAVPGNMAEHEARQMLASLEKLGWPAKMERAGTGWNVIYKMGRNPVVKMYCQKCGKEVPKPSDFRSFEDMRYYMMTGLCQNCADLERLHQLQEMQGPGVRAPSATIALRPVKITSSGPKYQVGDKVNYAVEYGMRTNGAILEVGKKFFRTGYSYKVSSRRWGDGGYVWKNERELRPGHIQRNPTEAKCTLCRWYGPSYTAQEHVQWKHGKDPGETAQYIKYKELPLIYRTGRSDDNPATPKYEVGDKVTFIYNKAIVESEVLEVGNVGAGYYYKVWIPDHGPEWKSGQDLTPVLKWWQKVDVMRGFAPEDVKLERWGNKMFPRQLREDEKWPRLRGKKGSKPLHVADPGKGEWGFPPPYYLSNPVGFAGLTLPITDIGQMSKPQVRRLQALAKKGLIVRYIDYTFPLPKSGYAERDPYYGQSLREQSARRSLESLEKGTWSFAPKGAKDRLAQQIVMSMHLNNPR